MVVKEVEGEIKKRITFDATRSGLNSCNQSLRINLPTASKLISRIRPGNILINLVLSDAYFYVPVKKSLHKIMTFLHPQSTKPYSYMILPFGILSCHYLFASFMIYICHIDYKVLNHYKFKQPQSVTYLDDWLRICSGYEVKTLLKAFYDTSTELGVGCLKD